jgi:hypothetical protein
MDTFAKKLFFRGDYENLKKLKAALSAYLVIEQARKDVDMRYDAFFATIMEYDKRQRVILPERMRIITWNYDSQLEKAFYGFCEDDQRVYDEIITNQNIYHINGYCGTAEPGHIGQAFRTVWNSDKESCWKEGIRLYKDCMERDSRLPTDIRFAWEEPTREKLGSTSFNLTGVSSLVIIGYSFPYFNREIDEVIFLELQESSLKRIYLQYPEDIHKSVEERIKPLLLGEVEIVYISDVEYFYIPAEFWSS